MTDQLRKSLGYVFDFASFLFLEKELADKVISVYLFGSAVRNELDEGSDIDIFINCRKTDENFILKASESARRKFTASADFEKWKALGFTYPLSIKAGNLHEWELKESILSEGIEIFSKSVQQHSTEKAVLFSFELPKRKKDYLKIKRRLFGRIEKGYRSYGIVEKSSGKQLASNIFIIPKSSQAKLIKLLHSEKISFSMMEFLKKAEE